MSAASSRQHVRIITDCVAALPPDRVSALKIGVLPVYLTLDGHSYLDDGNLDLAWFYGLLDHVASKPTTAAPSPQDLLDLYNRIAAEGATEIVALFVSSNLSSIYNHAIIAAQQCNAAQVHVVDTQQVSMGEGWLVLTAAEMAQQGASAAQILLKIRDMAKRAWVLGVIDDPDYLRRSGRVSWWAASMAGLLRIKPVIVLRSGQVSMLNKVRTMHRALQRLTNRVMDLGDLEHLAVLHSGADPRWTQELLALMQPLVPGKAIPLMDIGSIFATHVGPRAIGVALVTTGHGPGL